MARGFGGSQNLSVTLGLGLSSLLSFLLDLSFHLQLDLDYSHEADLSISRKTIQ